MENLRICYTSLFLEGARGDKKIRMQPNWKFDTHKQRLT
jgi:hypothetical protein